MLEVVFTPPCYNEACAREITALLYMHQGESGVGTKLMDRYQQFVAGKTRFEPPMGVYAFEHDRIVGGLTFYINNDWVFLECGYVKPDYRGRGIYTELMTEVEGIARKESLSGIFVSTYTFEAPALYEKLGFTLGCVLHDCPKGNTSMDYIKQFDDKQEKVSNTKVGMTIDEAIRILDPETTLSALAEIEYYAGFSGWAKKVEVCDEACRVAVAALREYGRQQFEA